MVEQTTAAAQTLSSETEALAAMMSRFKMARGSASSDDKPSRRSPASVSVIQMKTRGRGGAVPTMDQDNDWQDF